MNGMRGVLILALIAGLAPGLASAQEVFGMGGMPGALALPEDPGPLAEAVCAGRLTCVPEVRFEAGRDAAGKAITVIGLRFGLSEPVLPEDMPTDGCLDTEGRRDGGAEWHLLIDGRPVRRLLALCNDGYGASGVGDDEIMVSDNQLTHIQSGGSAWRWVETRHYQLSPLQLTGMDSCNYHNAMAWSGSRVSVDAADASVTVLAYREGEGGQDEAGIGCPTESDTLPMREKMRLLKAQAIPLPHLEGALKPGLGIGTCGLSIRADGSAGLVIHGTAAPAGKGATLRAVALDRQTLLLQVSDPAALTGGQGARSWVGQPHVEIYLRGQDDKRPFGQLGITLDGQIHAGVGAAALPRVTVSRDIDENRRDVTRLTLRFADEDVLTGGLVLVYSEAAAGRQIRLTATAPIEGLSPLLAPAPTAVPSLCAADERGLLNIVGAASE